MVIVQLLQLTSLINKYETIFLIFFRMRFNSAKIRSHVSIYNFPRRKKKGKIIK